MLELLAGPWIPLLIVGTAFVFMAGPVWRQWRVYEGASKRRMSDASSSGWRPSPDMAPLIGELGRLGFSRLGEAQVRIEGVRAVSLATTTRPTASPTTSSEVHTTFVLVDAEGTVTAEVVQVPRMAVFVGFTSTFGDGSCVETQYPLGELIEDVDFYSGHSRQSVSRAYEQQRTVIARWRVRHGAPRVVATMAEMLAANALYRERFSKRKLRGPFLRRNLLPAAFWFASLALFVGVTYAMVH